MCPTASTNIIAMRSHRITHANRLADQGTKQGAWTGATGLCAAILPLFPHLRSRINTNWDQQKHRFGDKARLPKVWPISTGPVLVTSDQWELGRGLWIAWVTVTAQRHGLQTGMASLPPYNAASPPRVLCDEDAGTDIHCSECLATNPVVQKIRMK